MSTASRGPRPPTRRAHCSGSRPTSCASTTGTDRPRTASCWSSGSPGRGPTRSSSTSERTSDSGRTAFLAQPGHPAELHAVRALVVLARPGQPRRWLIGPASTPSRCPRSPGEAELQIVKEGAGVNSLVPFEGERAASATETVTVETVDRFCADHGIRAHHPAQGRCRGAGPERASAGQREMLARGDIGIVQFEYNWRWVFSRTYLKDVFDLIGDLPRYSLGKVDPEGDRVLRPVASRARDLPRGELRPGPRRLARRLPARSSGGAVNPASPARPGGR